MPPDALQLRFWRLGIAAWLALDSVLMAVMTASEGGLYTGWLDAPGTLGAVATRPWLIWLIAAFALVGVADFARRRDSVIGGLVYLVAMATLDLAFGASHGTYGGRFYFSALLLTGSIVGRLSARVLGLDPRRSPSERLEVERFAAFAALALLSTAYVNAFLTKLTSSDLSWRETDHLHLVILSRMALDGSLSHTLQAFLTDNPAAIRALNLFTLIVEAGAPVILVGPRVRMFWAILLLCFHVGIYMAFGLFWGSAIYFMLLLGFPWHQIPWLRARLSAAEGPPPPDPTPLVLPPRLGARAVALFTGLALLLGALWVLPIERRLDPVAWAGQSAGGQGEHLGARVDRLGPLHEGLSLGAGWSVAGIHAARASVHVELRASETDHVTVGLGPAGTGGHGSFLDVGDLSLWHLPTETDHERFSPAIDALAARLEALAPPGRSVAAALQASASAAGVELHFKLDESQP